MGNQIRTNARPPRASLAAAAALVLLIALNGPVSSAEPTTRPREFDVLVYGGTSGGVASAVQAARMGKRVALINPTRHLGGMTSGGLGWTDMGRPEIVGGLAREFYHRVFVHYQSPNAWKHDTRERFADAGAQHAKAIDAKRRV